MLGRQSAHDPRSNSVQTMKPMTPLKPMESMKPMQEISPLSERGWWPEEFGKPSSAGSQNDLRYAFFPQQRRLVIERQRELCIYDSGGYDINGISQSSGQEHAVRFTTNGRDVALDALVRLA